APSRMWRALTASTGTASIPSGKGARPRARTANCEAPAYTGALIKTAISGGTPLAAAPAPPARPTRPTNHPHPPHPPPPHARPPRRTYSPHARWSPPAPPFPPTRRAGNKAPGRGPPLPRLVGGRLCLDFANSANWDGEAIVDEKLAAPADVVAWARHAGLGS